MSFRPHLIITALVTFLIVGLTILMNLEPIQKQQSNNTSLEKPQKNTSEPKLTTQSPKRPNTHFKRRQQETKIKLPKDALPNERIVYFKTDQDYQDFLNSLKTRHLLLLGKSDLLRSIRIGFTAKSNLNGIKKDQIAYNYFASTPPPPSASTQKNAIGFGANTLSWLGVTGDNSTWGKGITVAVLDSGVNQHIALKGNIQQVNLMELKDGASQSGHGTAVASIISGDHPLTPGIAPASDILSIRVTDETGSSNAFTLAKGILEAVDKGAQIINISMGSYGDSKVMKQAVDYALEKGAVIVASSGNKGLNGQLAYPAAYKGVISVGAVEKGGEHLNFSNTGDTLNISAPGYKIYAAWGTDKLTAFSGTSASAPFVSGAIAAVKSENPSLSVQQASERVLKFTADAGAPNRDSYYGNGVLDLGQVMQYGTPGIYDIAVTGQTLSNNGTSNIQVTLQNQGTETLYNSPVTISTPNGQQLLNISSLAPGKTASFQVPISIPTDGSPVKISTSAQSTQGDTDTSNNQRSSIFSQIKR